MDVTDIVSLVANNGFAIVMAIYLLSLYSRMQTEHRNEIQDVMKTTTENNNKMLDALNNNTNALIMLEKRLEYLEKGVKNDG